MKLFYATSNTLRMFKIVRQLPDRQKLKTHRNNIIIKNYIINTVCTEDSYTYTIAINTT